jgi:hypothetical protein
VREDELGYLGVIMLQMSLKEGLKFWGEKGQKSAIKEMTQLHNWTHSSHVIQKVSPKRRG